ncbi:MAG TPA: hypothetical protein VHT73_06240 [Thermodesulfobacteriota bacterium]|nr:hypothetical protein [Thermodesulfobacteriota bacterium]
MRKFTEYPRNSRISIRKELAILEILNPANKSLQAIATKLGLNESTLRKWLKTEEFQLRLEEGRERITRASFEKLEIFINEAVDGLSELMHSENESIRLKACLEVVFFCRERVREKQIVERLDKLTEELGQCQETIGRRRF